MNNINKVPIVTPIPNFFYTIGQLPTSFLESMTYQEQLIWLCNYFSKTIEPNLSELDTGFNQLLENFNSLDTEVTEKVAEQDDKITNGLATIENDISAELPTLVESVVNAKIAAGEISVQLSETYNSETEALTLAIQVTDGD